MCRVRRTGAYNIDISTLESIACKTHFDIHVNGITHRNTAKTETVHTIVCYLSRISGGEEAIAWKLSTQCFESVCKESCMINYFIIGRSWVQWARIRWRQVYLGQDAKIHIIQQKTKLFFFFFFWDCAHKQSAK